LTQGIKISCFGQAISANLTEVAITHIYFGGSFYPPHKAHTEMLQQALKHNRDAEILLIPTKQNPLKESRGAEMALIQAWLEDLGDQLSYQEFSRVRLETIEILSDEEKNYTVNTLRELASEDQNWALLLGSDAASKFSHWKNPAEILEMLSEIWVVPRGEDDTNEIVKNIESVNSSKNSINKTKVVFLQKVKDISSTQIRNLTQQLNTSDGASSQPLDELLTPRVLAVWKQHLAC